MDEEHSKNLKPMASIYWQVQELISSANIIGISNNLKMKDAGIEWLRDVFNTFLKIKQFQNDKLNGQLMILSDYRRYNFFTQYLH